MQRKTLEELLKKHHFLPASFSQVKTGKFNLSYLVEIKDAPAKYHLKHQIIFLRIAPEPNTGFIFYEKDMMAQEPEIYQIIKEQTSIPVPEIYVYDNSHETIPQSYMIMEYIPGKALSETNLPQFKTQEVIRQTGAYLKELHQKCQSDQYGYLGPHKCMEPKSSWEKAFHEMWNKLIDDIENCGVYKLNDAMIARKALDNHLEKFKLTQPASLLHMDIWSQNIMVDHSGKVTGIVDWDRTLWGDPGIEFAVADYCGFNTEAFWDGYGNKPAQDEAAGIRSKFYHFYEIQKYLVIWTLRRRDPIGAASYKSYALTELKELLR
ncbi:MAG: phosphotransferase family protein [Candidatus Cyclobacteriaceae bacterium M3_2C_046]